MRLKGQEIALEFQGEPIRLKRDENGVPQVTSVSEAGAYFGLGWVHANDRMVQMMLVRLIARGEASENLKGTDEFIAIDTFMRKINFRDDARAQVNALDADSRSVLEAYTTGVNEFLGHNRLPFEFKLIKYKPEPWKPEDSLITIKIMGYVGLAQAQGDMEKLIVQMIRNGTSLEKLNELFPGQLNGINMEALKKVTLESPKIPQSIKWLHPVPHMSASNNWAVAPSKSASGKAVYCSDPHLEVNRLPGVWYEIMMKFDGNAVIGTTIPGVPGILYGRTGRLAWGFTYSFMDMIDFYIEDCKDGAFRRGSEWVPFNVRKETIRPKGKAPVILSVYENLHGFLEGDPNRPGYYLTTAWSGRQNGGADALMNMIKLPRIKSTKEAMEAMRNVDIPPLDFIFADRDGNIGFQMCGRMPRRKKGWSGLYPVEGWMPENDWQGFVDPADLPRSYNPECGFLATANNDLNHLGRAKPINLPMAPYRYDRIMELLTSKEKLGVDDMKKMHYDLYSKQAELFMPIIRPLLPDSPAGELLKKWDFRYGEDSKAAFLFEKIYRELLGSVFGQNEWGEDVFNYMDRETGIFIDFYGNFDRVLLRESAVWFNGSPREQIYRKAIEKALSGAIKTYGETRQITMVNLFFGGKLPKFLGFDYGPFPLKGNRATIIQGAIYKNDGLSTTFHPSYRMIADFATDVLETNIAGGPSDRRFSKWYTSDVENWRHGSYKKLQIK
ncbi:acyl-homoserine lactone acylase QuiP precursor [bacterium BMS3Abin05]|nr:acyl-homoserine lactone acylase QuiP precursor [bacterium BMS3Abin05]